MALLGTNFKTYNKLIQGDAAANGLMFGVTPFYPFLYLCLFLFCLSALFKPSTHVRQLDHLPSMVWQKRSLAKLSRALPRGRHFRPNCQV